MFTPTNFAKLSFSGKRLYSKGIYSDRVKIMIWLLPKLRYFIFLTLVLFAVCSTVTEKSKQPISVRFCLIDESHDANTPVMKNRGNGELLHVCEESFIVLSDISSAETSQISEEIYGILITLTSEATEKFGNVTKNNIGRKVGVVIDGELVMAPVIREGITDGKAVITGRFTEIEARDIAKRINESVTSN